MSYPRTETIRKGWVLRQAGKLVVFVGLMGFIIEQVNFLGQYVSHFDLNGVSISGSHKKFFDALLDWSSIIQIGFDMMYAVFGAFVHRLFHRTFVIPKSIMSKSIFQCSLQYINPTVRNSQHPLKGNYLQAVERVLKLSMPVLYVWLCLFYCLFHLWYVHYCN